VDADGAVEPGSKPALEAIDQVTDAWCLQSSELLRTREDDPCHRAEDTG